MVGKKIKVLNLQGRVIKTPYSTKEKDSENLIIKWVDSQKEGSY